MLISALIIVMLGFLALSAAGAIVESIDPEELERMEVVRQFES